MQSWNSVCEVVPGLWLGGVAGLNQLQGLGVSHVLTVMDGRPALPLSGFTTRHIHIADEEHSDLLSELPAALTFIQDALQGCHQAPSGRVYVHCMAGVSRSVTVVMAYLLFTQQPLTVEQAFEHVRRVRPIARPNPGFFEQLLLFEQLLQMGCSLEFQDNPLYTAWKKKRAARTETLRDVTVLQLLRDNDNTSNETYMVDGVELQLMTLVGRITHQVENAGSCITYTLHDGTGAVSGLCFINDDSEEKLNKLRSDLTVGKYVRVFGVPRNDPNDNKITVQSYKIRPVTDFNEITYHNLQVIFQRLHLKQGAPPQGAMPAMQGGMPQGQMPMGGIPAPAPAGATLYDQLNALYHSPEVVSQPQGIHINNVMSMLQQQGISCSLAQVKEAVEGLVSDGHLYSTVDDDTHRICE